MKKAARKGTANRSVPHTSKIARTGWTVAEIATRYLPRFVSRSFFIPCSGNDNTEVPLLASPEEDHAVLHVGPRDQRVDVRDVPPAHVGAALAHQAPGVALRGAQGRSDEQVHDADSFRQLRAGDLHGGHPGEVAGPAGFERG